MMGYGLTFGLDRKWRLLGQIAFTIIGFFNFFKNLFSCLVINEFIVYPPISKKFTCFGYWYFSLVGLLTYNAFLPNSNPRLEAMSNILAGKSNNTSKLEEG